MWPLLPLLLACAPQPSPAPAPAPPAVAFSQDWVLLYYIPYDNDLGGFAEPVLEQLRAATAGSNVEVAALTDLPGPGGVTLTMFSGGVGRPYPDPATEDMADPATFRGFLEQAASLYQARHYAVMVLDHGGDLMHVARDDHPRPRWLNVRDISAALADFRRAEPGEVELLFLQVCAKGALAPVLAVQDAAATTLVAQTLLGAPNDYYVPAIRALGAHPAWRGPELSAAIAQGSMYVSLSCVDNAALSRLPAVASAAVGAGAVAAPEERIADARYIYGGEAYVDLGALASGVGTPEASELARWLREELLCGHHVAPAPRAALTAGGPDPAHLSGISTHVPGGRRSVVDDVVPGWSGWVDAALSGSR